MPYINGKMVPWAPEDYIDHGVVANLLPKSCEDCKHAERDPRKMNDCVACILSGWQDKKRFIKATRSKASKSIPDDDLLAAIDERCEDPGDLIAYLDKRKLPELARAVKLLGYKVPFGSKKNVYINEIVAGGMI